MGRFLILFIFFLNLFSCNWLGDSLSPSKIQKTSTQETLPVSLPTQKKTWEEVLGELILDPFVKLADGSVLTLKITNREPFTEENFRGFLFQIGDGVNELQFPYGIILVEASGEEQTIFKGRFYLNDISEYKNNKISQPEMLRRIQVDVVETLESLKRQVKQARAEGNLNLAQEAAQKWLKIEPSSTTALSLLGNVYRDQKKYWDAIYVYQKIIQLLPDSLFAYHNLGYCFERVGSFDDATASYKKALEIKPNDPLLMQQLALVYTKNRDYNGAMVLIAKLREMGDNANLWMIQGNLDRDFKKYNQAREAYKKAQEINPADMRFLYNQLLLDLDTKQYSDAKKKYEELEEKDLQLAQELEGIYLFKE